jgi:hypothetical protein
MGGVSHVIKYTHDDGVKLRNPTTWCGHNVYAHDWCFQDASHVLLALDKSTCIAPCKRCLMAMRRVINKELKG